MNDAKARVRSQEEAKTAVRNSLRTIEALCKIYDDGNYETARDIATVGHRMIVEELSQTRIRRDLKFISFGALPNPRNLVMQYLTSTLEVNFKSDGGDPTITITHKPLFDELAEAIGQPTTMRFSEWWNGPVWISGAADGPMIPTSESQQIPFHKREKNTRFDDIRKYRNKTGAHFGLEIDADTQQIEDKLIRAFDIGVSMDNSTSFSYTSTPKVFMFKNSRAQAIVRHIAFEIIKSRAEWEVAGI